jgi:hypothetical protein
MIVTLSIILLLAGVAFGVSSESWKQRGTLAFSEGTLDKVSITGEGQIILAPPSGKIAGVPEKVIWMLAEDKKDRIYLATGNEGKIYKVSIDGEAELFFDAEEIGVHAIAFDREDALFAATSPDGKVYKIDESGSHSIFCDPEDKYIWDMLPGEGGSLYIATGEKGNIYKVSQEGDIQLFYKSNSDHIRTINFEQNGNLIAGTAGDGLIVRISPEGEAFVLLDSSRQEISSLALSREGIIYAAAVGEKERKDTGKAIGPLGFPMEVVKVIGSREKNSMEKKGDTEPSVPEESVEERITTGGSEIFKIEKEGSPRQIWESPGEVVHSLLLDDEGNLLVGTGEKGIIYKIDKDHRASTLMKMDDHQITCMRPSRGRILVGSGNNATLSFIGKDFSAEGEYLSQVKDTEGFSTWGMFQGDYETPSGTRIMFHTRSGNTREPNESWSSWKTLSMDSGSSAIDSPGARFIQWKAELKRKPQIDKTPVIRSVTVNYLPENLSPEIKTVEVQPPGIFYQKLPVPQVTGTEISGTLNRSKTQAEKSVRPVMLKPPVKKVYQYGTRTVSWVASDPNGDDLIFSLDFKGVEEEQWKTLKKEQSEDFCSWDSRLMADGVYMVRVVASDLASNPESLAKKVEKKSNTFTIDNTPPSVSSIKWSLDRDRVTVSFSVSDRTSPIEDVEYSINADDWKMLFPDDKVYDSLEESFYFTLFSLRKGEYTLVIKAMDDTGNIGSGKAIITIED